MHKIAKKESCVKENLLLKCNRVASMPKGIENISGLEQAGFDH